MLRSISWATLSREARRHTPLRDADRPDLAHRAMRQGPLQNVPPQVQPSNQTLNPQGGHAAPFTSPSSYKLCASHGDDLRRPMGGELTRRRSLNLAHMYAHV
jgi:hypothetical protein